MRYETSSKYEYPGTNVLKNIPGIRDEEKLNAYEDAVSSLRIAQLHMKPLRGQFDFKHLKDIHYHIFQDVYPFAGKQREEDIAKDHFTFAHARFITGSAEDLFKQLLKEDQLINLPKNDFSDRAAHFMAEINVLHPFREGNGRTTREFIRQLSQHAGYELDWTKVDKNIVLQASIRSITDTRSLAQVIKESISNEAPDRAVRERYLGISRERDR